ARSRYTPHSPPTPVSRQTIRGGPLATGRGDACHKDHHTVDRGGATRERLGIFGRRVPVLERFHAGEFRHDHDLRRRLFHGPVGFDHFGTSPPDEVAAAELGDRRRGAPAVVLPGFRVKDLHL